MDCSSDDEQSPHPSWKRRCTFRTLPQLDGQHNSSDSDNSSVSEDSEELVDLTIEPPVLMENVAAPDEDDSRTATPDLLSSSDEGDFEYSEAESSFDEEMSGLVWEPIPVINRVKRDHQPSPDSINNEATCRTPSPARNGARAYVSEWGDIQDACLPFYDEQEVAFARRRRRSLTRMVNCELQEKSQGLRARRMVVESTTDL